MVLTRRALGKVSLGGVASRTLLAQSSVPVAVQLYSVRQIAAKDLPGVLAEVAKLGYKGVEFAGYHGHEAPAVRKMLDENGLKVAGTHIGLDMLLGDNLQKTLEFNKTIGNKNLIVSSMPRKYSASAAGWKEAAQVFNEISDKVRPQGFTVGYHNHTQEFQLVEGQTPFEIFFGTAKPAVKVQLDVGHAKRAGADPVQVINRYKGRVISIHVKEYSPDKPEPILGEGSIDWKGVFSALERNGGIEWYIVEEEGKSCVDYNCIQTAIGQLKKMGKA
ncbi:MAG TPA: sugar phosphate isomerase/epimerase [Bryobacteraceae bacterium]|nr:sugar phosphate isomerase/epimerase [Bryobacteraceae bacterium]